MVNFNGSSMANPLPFGPPADYQGGIPEDLAELGFGLPKPPVRDQRVPGDGHLILPHVATFQSIVNLASRTYFTTFDEALRDNRENCRVMRYDPTVMSALRDRQVPVVQLPWHIEADDESDPYQKEMVDEATKIFLAIPRFQDMRRQLLEAIWFGKYGVQTAFRWDYARGFKRMMVQDHSPVMGDKIVMTFGGRPGILVHGAYQGPRVMTDMGMAHLLSPDEREQFVLHTFEPEDADLMQGDFAGQRYGYGVRGRIYWWWWQRNVVTQWMMDFLQTIGVGGIMVYYYEEGNDASLAAATEAANNQQSSQAILMPRRRNLQGGVDEVTEVDRIEASTAGAQLIYDVIVNYFNQVIRDYILMERLTTRTGSTGLGSNVAAAHERTAADRQRYDAEPLDETTTRDLLWVIQRYTWPKCPPERAPLRFKSDVDKPDPMAWMQSAKMFIDLGGSVKEDDARRIVGLDKPKEGDPVLGGILPQPMAQQPPANGVVNDASDASGGQDGGADRHAATRAGWETKEEMDGSEPLEHHGTPVRLGRNGGYTPEREDVWESSGLQTAIPVVQSTHVPDVLEGSTKLPYDLASGERELIPDVAPYGRRLTLGGPMKLKRKVTEAMKKAGNFKMKHMSWRGLDISVENRKGSIRSGTSKDGKAWSNKLTCDYGYIKRSIGADGDHLDIYVGPDLDRNRVFAINQIDPDTGEFDEVKLVVGVRNRSAARRLYLSNYQKGWKGLGSMEEMTVADLKAWIADGDTSEPVPSLPSPVGESMQAANRDDAGKLTLAGGGPLPSFIVSNAVPKTWKDIKIALEESNPIWMTASEGGKRRTVYNPVLAPAYARLNDAIENLKLISDHEIMQMVHDDAVEAPFTADDLLSALATRTAARFKSRPGEEPEEHIRRVSTAISRQVGVPATVLVQNHIAPQVW